MRGMAYIHILENSLRNLNLTDVIFLYIISFVEGLRVVVGDKYLIPKRKKENGINGVEVISC